jgi:hypothetical protein
MSMDKADLKRMGIQDSTKSIEKEIADIDRIAGRRGKQKHFSFEEEFPLYAMITRDEDRKRREEERKKASTHSSLSAFDPVYESFGKMMGLEVPASQLNLAYTPQIIQNVVMTLVEANFTPAGSGIMSLGLGIAFFLAGIVGRKTLVTNDQLLLQNLSASFFWRTMEFVNPKRHFKESIKETIHEIKDGHYSPKIFFETPKAYEEDMRSYQSTTPATPAAPGAPGAPATPPAISGATPVAPQSNIIGTTDTSTPAQYQLAGDDYYEDTDQVSVPRNIYSGQVDNIALAQTVAQATDPTTASYASDDEEYYG